MRQILRLNSTRYDLLTRPCRTCSKRRGPRGCWLSLPGLMDFGSQSAVKVTLRMSNTCAFQQTIHHVSGSNSNNGYRSARRVSCRTGRRCATVSRLVLTRQYATCRMFFTYLVIQMWWNLYSTLIGCTNFTLTRFFTNPGSNPGFSLKQVSLNQGPLCTPTSVWGVTVLLQLPFQLFPAHGSIDSWYLTSCV